MLELERSLDPSTHPVLIQRPILTADDGTTMVGRSPEAVQQVLDASH